MSRSGAIGAGTTYDAAVRTAMRELFAAVATANGLPVPAGVLATDVQPDESELNLLRDRLAGFAPAGGRDDIELFGSAYESLLEAADRRHAGAHYTPLELADEVVEHALESLVSDDLLDLSILDLAAGSGIFLISAARYLARRGADLRAVISTCLYGADVNPTAVEICKLSLWLLAADPDLPVTFLDDKILHGDSLLSHSVGDRKPVDWNRAAPNVMAAGGFDAVIGNPPFLGVKNIRTAVGRDARDHYATTLLDGESGRSDLVVFFLAQATRLSRNIVGLVVPDAIAEGDSARFGLGRAQRNGYRIYRAESSRPWPGTAGVRIALIWLERVPSAAPAILDGEEVPWIGPHLRGDAAGAGHRRAQPPAWMPHGFQATIVLGKSLVLTRDEAAELTQADPRVGDYLRDYLSGDDLVSAPASASSRQVLDLGRSELAPLLAIAVLGERLGLVRAERAEQLEKYPQLAGRWWGFLNPVDRLYDALADLPETIALSKHTKYIWPVLVPTGPVFSNGVIVYPSNDRAVYAFLASTPHRLWAVDEGGSRLNKSHRYNPSRLLTRYPFPDSFEAARDAGHQLADAVAAAGAELGVGITELLNQVHRPGSVPGAVRKVRRAFVEVDRAVLGCHGITEQFDYDVQVESDRSRFGVDRASEVLIKSRLLG